MAKSEKNRIREENNQVVLHLSERKTTVFILAFTNILSLLLLIVLTYAVAYRFPIKQYLWTSDARAVCDAMPVSKPTVSDARVIDFATNAAVDLNSFDYLNWHRMLTRAMSIYLTPAERIQYKRELQSSGIIQTVEQGDIVLTSDVSGRPYIKSEGVRASDHRYYWDVQVPLQLWYYNGSDSKSEKRVLEMTIIRVSPSPTNPDGIAIDGLVSVQQVEQSAENQLN